MGSRLRPLAIAFVLSLCLAVRVQAQLPTTVLFDTLPPPDGAYTRGTSYVSYFGAGDFDGPLSIQRVSLQAGDKIRRVTVLGLFGRSNGQGGFTNVFPGFGDTGGINFYNSLESFNANPAYGGVYAQGTSTVEAIGTSPAGNTILRYTYNLASDFTATGPLFMSVRSENSLPGLIGAFYWTSVIVPNGEPAYQRQSGSSVLLPNSLGIRVEGVSINPSVAPEPSTALLLGPAMLSGLMLKQRRKKALWDFVPKQRHV